MGEAAEEISQEAALVGGALASGGIMSTSLHQQFVQTVVQARLFEKLNSSPYAWPRNLIVGGAGLVAVILSCALLLGFGNRIGRELTGLRAAARTLATERLPALVSRLRAGENVDVAAEAPPLDLGTRTREVTDTVLGGAAHRSGGGGRPGAAAQRRQPRLP